MTTPTDADSFQVVAELPVPAAKETTRKPLSDRQRLFRFLVAHPNQWVATKTRPVSDTSSNSLFHAAANSLRGYGLDAELRTVDGSRTLYVRLTVSVNGGDPQ